MLEVCHAAGKRMVFKQMFDAWSLVASDRRCYDVLFRYPETVIPMYATNNGHAPEVQVHPVARVAARAAPSVC